jgi:hypothetical protein
MQSDTSMSLLPFLRLSTLAWGGPLRQTWRFSPRWCPCLAEKTKIQIISSWHTLPDRLTDRHRHTHRHTHRLANLFLKESFHITLQGTQSISDKSERSDSSPLSPSCNSNVCHSFHVTRNVCYSFHATQMSDVFSSGHVATYSQSHINSSDPSWGSDKVRYLCMECGDVHLLFR